MLLRSYFEKNFHDRIHYQIVKMLFSLLLVIFPNSSFTLCVFGIGGLTMAAPVGHLTFEFNSIRFNSLGSSIDRLGVFFSE